MQSQPVRNSSSGHNPCCLDSSTCDVAYAEACSACGSYDIWAGANCDVATSDPKKSCLGALPKKCLSHLHENCDCNVVEDDATLHLQRMSCCEHWNVWVPASGEASRCLHTSSCCHVGRGSIAKICQTVVHLQLRNICARCAHDHFCTGVLCRLRALGFSSARMGGLTEALTPLIFLCRLGSPIQL